MPDFNSQYQKLNPEQKTAVDTLDGPVMVIAGAGTGKTQTIALRIANILQKTQTNPSSILCLTFTDTAVNAMRTRLVGIIGPTAYSVRIHTFHSFCNEVILSHPEYFIFSHDLQPVDELEKLEIINDLIDKLPNGSVLQPWGDHYFYQRDIVSAIQTLKRENVPPEKLQQLISDQELFLSLITNHCSLLKSLRIGKTLESDLQKIVDSLPVSPIITYHSNLYQNGGYDIGAAKNPAINFKNALLKIFDNLIKDTIKQKELLVIYRGYQLALKEHGLYDFDDMILFVVEAFKKDQDLLRSYQEQYQYFLVDEFQDTNSAQNEILSLLCRYFDNPNIFVVGDDDQSVFRFQGASIENIYDFYKKYKVKPIVLKNNYRSHQLILDTSTTLINNNQNRIANYIKDIDKSLKSTSILDPNPINLIPVNSVLEENYFVTTKIKTLVDSGVKPSEIAILCRTNTDATDLADSLTKEGIRFYLPSNQNILDSPHIRQLINLLSYINDPTRNDIYYHLLASDYFNLNDLDLLKLFKKDNSLSKNSQVKIRNLNRRIAKARKWLENSTLDQFFNKVIRKFKFLDFCLSQKDPQVLNHLLTFYNELKQLSLDKKYSLTQFLNRLEMLDQNKLAMAAPPLTTSVDDSVQLLTVHRAKGLEFEHVFLIKVIDKKWGNGRDMNRLHLPYGVLKYDIASEVSDQNEDERRLFYVALTRAKKQIYISYATKTNTNRDQLPSIFISEIDPAKAEIISLPKDIQLIALQKFFPTNEISISQDYADYLKNFLAHDYIFNVTHLNSYLRCPFCFYHQTILRIPSVKDKFNSLGTAIHHALSYFYLHQQSTLDKVISDFSFSLSKQSLGFLDHQETLARGIQILTDYFNNYHQTLCQKVLVDYDFKSANIRLNDIPLTGKIDLVEVLNDRRINVVDFKTGNPDNKYQELSPDGDYFRQLVFYKLLISLDPTFKQQLNLGIIDFVQKSKSKDSYVRKEFKITPENIKDLETKITDVYHKILNLDFFHLGPDCQDHQHLHYLLK